MKNVTRTRPSRALGGKRSSGLALPGATTQFGLPPGLSTATGHRTAMEAIGLPGPFDREAGRVASMYLWGQGRPEHGSRQT